MSGYYFSIHFHDDDLTVKILGKNALALGLGNSTRRIS
jgi:hypothetical protein